MAVDSHCHLTLRYEPHELPGIFSNALSAGVRGLLLVGYDPDHYRSVTAILDTYGTGGNGIPALAGTIGIHPHEADKYNHRDIEKFAGELARLEIVAIGETGLDFFRDYADRDRQEGLFRAQIELASVTGIPLVIHSRQAFDKTVQVLEDYDLPEKPGVFHCYGYGPDELGKVLEMGFYVSFAGNLTYPKATDLHQAARRVPPDRMLIETDSPFLIPQKSKNRKVRRNEPALITETLDKLVELKNIEKSDAERMLIRNIMSCFPKLNGIESWAMIETNMGGGN